MIITGIKLGQLKAGLQSQPAFLIFSLLFMAPIL